MESAQPDDAPTMSEVLARLTETADALRHLSSASTSPGPTSLAALAAELDEAVSCLRQRVDTLPDGTADNALTPQERQVLLLLADGMTNREIGERMSLAEKTVKNYVTSVLAKLGVQRRTQAAVLLTRAKAWSTGQRVRRTDDP